MLYSLLYVLCAVVLVWWIFRTIRNNPAAFSKENISKSLTTVGLLALLIIAVIYVAVLFLKH